ncbi:MAG: hypothetical protein QHC79_25955 [Pseudosphingobacterium sp.]|nr:hypothetical protein [Pseudosphingobacterium sp.]
MHKHFEKISRDEICFIRRNAPRGLYRMVQRKTGRSRAQVDYQLRLEPRHQDLVVIQAAREILKVVTGLSFHKQDPDMKDGTKYYP